jgi:hypothetical protein
VLKSAAGWQARKLAELQIPSYGEDAPGGGGGGAGGAGDLRGGPPTRLPLRGLKGFYSRLKLPKAGRAGRAAALPGGPGAAGY